MKLMVFVVVVAMRLGVRVESFSLFSFWGREDGIYGRRAGYSRTKRWSLVLIRNSACWSYILPSFRLLFVQQPNSTHSSVWSVSERKRHSNVLAVHRYLCWRGGNAKEKEGSCYLLSRPSLSSCSSAVLHRWSKSKICGKSEISHRFCVRPLPTSHCISGHSKKQDRRIGRLLPGLLSNKNSATGSNIYEFFSIHLEMSRSE